jgi:tRNA dimethylallyltransferase
MSPSTWVAAASSESPPVGRLVSPRLLLGVVGPTAAGKSALALRLAEALGGEVLGCDALQIRAGLPILTAKPTAAEAARVPHHLIGVLPIDQPATAAQYAAQADAAIAQVHARGRTVIVCGGTGLYLRALRDGLFLGPGGDPALRTELRAQVAAHGLGALHARLQTVDPVAAARIAPADYVRIERALEVFALTGRPISDWQADSQRERQSGPRYRLLLVGVDPGPEILRTRIAARVEAMIAAGVVAEVQAALGVHGPLRYPPLGYEQVCRHLAGELALPAMALEIGQKTAQYARRQRTWFRREPAISRWIASADAPSAELDALVGELLAAARA